MCCRLFKRIIGTQNYEKTEEFKNNEIQIEQNKITKGDFSCIHLKKSEKKNPDIFFGFF